VDWVNKAFGEEAALSKLDRTIAGLDSEIRTLDESVLGEWAGRGGIPRDFSWLRWFAFDSRPHVSPLLLAQRPFVIRAHRVRWRPVIWLRRKTASVTCTRK